MARFVMTEADNKPEPMPRWYINSRGERVQHQNKNNNPLAEMFVTETANFTALVVKHFAPLAHTNMSNHIRLAEKCQVGSLGEDNCFTCIAMNADVTCKCD